MTLKTIIASLVAVFFIAATIPKTGSEGKLKTYYSTQNRDTTAYHYDAEGRLSDFTASRDYKTTYIYSGNTVIENTQDGRKVLMFLNAAGFVDSSIDVEVGQRITAKYNPADKSKKYFRPTRDFHYYDHFRLSYLNGFLSDYNASTVSHKYSYNKEGFLIKDMEYVNGKLHMTLSCIVEGGNVISYSTQNFERDTITRIDSVTHTKDTKIINYGDYLYHVVYSDKLNPFGVHTLFGKSSKNLMTEEVQYSVYNNVVSKTDSSITTYRYTFDKQARPATMTKAEKSTDTPWLNTDAMLSDTCRFTFY